MIFFAHISFLYLSLGHFSRLLQNDVGDQLQHQHQHPGQIWELNNNLKTKEYMISNAAFEANRTNRPEVRSFRQNA